MWSSCALVRPETIRSSTSVSQAIGSTPFSLAVWIRVIAKAQCRAPPSLPANNAFLRVRTLVAPGRHAALLLDQAGWHTSTKLDVPENITIVPLPPKCPELNPQENVWQFIRDNWLSNRVFASYDNLVDHCCDAWNRLVAQPWTIMSLGLREWADGF